MQTVQQVRAEDVWIEQPRLLNASTAVEQQVDIDGRRSRVEPPSLERCDLLRDSIFAQVDFVRTEIRDEIVLLCDHLEPYQRQVSLGAEGHGRCFVCGRLRR